MINQLRIHNRFQNFSTKTWLLLLLCDLNLGLNMNLQVHGAVVV